MVFPWFIGAIYRGEQSLAVWDQYGIEKLRHGQGDALLSVYLYAVFYLTLVALPYAILGFRYTSESPESRDYFRVGRVLIGLWLAATFLLFARSIFAFIRNLPDEIWNGWLLILWLGSAFIFAALVLVLERRLRRSRSGEPSDGV